REALESMARQAGGKLKIRDNDERASKLVDVDFAGVPFWSAWDTLGSQNSLVDDPLCREARALGLGFWDGRAPYTHHQGAFRFMANRLDYQLHVQRSVDLLPLSRRVEPKRLPVEWLHMMFTIEAEPRLHIVSATVDRITEARDDRNVLASPKSGVAFVWI